MIETLGPSDYSYLLRSEPWPTRALTETELVEWPRAPHALLRPGTDRPLPLTIRNGRLTERRDTAR